jgi:Fur family ferric uptake transcriptional regulator
MVAPTKQKMPRRQTNQRKIILDYLQKVRDHPTAEAVYSEVKKKIPKITLATVYRNLHVLAEENLVQELEVDKEYHFDVKECKCKTQDCINCRDKSCNHIHLHCDTCHSIVDVEDKKLTRKIVESAQKSGFEVNRIELIVRGICKDCQ